MIDKEQSSRRGGRPRGFERDGAVTTAMRLFRRYGYEGVSLSMLTGAIGIAAPSLYAAFGSKADLYREVLDRYAQEAELSLRPPAHPDEPFHEAVSRLLDRAIILVTQDGEARGCMISTGLLGCHPDHEELETDLASRRHTLAVQLEEELLFWLPGSHCAPTAAFLCAILQGIAVQARDGSSAQQLGAMAMTAQSWARQLDHRNARRPNEQAGPSVPSTDEFDLTRR